MKYYTTKPGEYPKRNKENTEDEFFSEGWSVKREGENYSLTYISGSLQGNLKTIQISKEDFESAKIGELNLDQLCAKYNVS